MFRLLRLVSLLLLALLLAAWMRSYRFAEGIEITAPRGSFQLTSHPGRVQVCWPAPAFIPCTAYGLTVSSAPRVDPRWSWEGEEHVVSFKILSRGTDAARRQLRFVQVPVWALAAVAGIYPVMVFIRWIRRRRRLRSGALCLVCEYDLRGISDRCPECGTSLQPSPTRRGRGAWLLIGGKTVCVLLAGVWFTLHDFRSTRCQSVDFATLGGFTFDQEKGTLGEIPDRIRQLDGQRIAIDGYMFPMDQAESATVFALFPEQFGFHGPPPLIQQAIVARIITGKVAGYNFERIRVFGILHVRVTYDSGSLVSIFDMVVDGIQPAPSEPPPTPNKRRSH